MARQSASVPAVCWGGRRETPAKDKPRFFLCKRDLHLLGNAGARLARDGLKNLRQQSESSLPCRAERAGAAAARFSALGVFSRSNAGAGASENPLARGASGETRFAGGDGPILGSRRPAASAARSPDFNALPFPFNCGSGRGAGAILGECARSFSSSASKIVRTLAIISSMLSPPAARFAACAASGGLENSAFAGFWSCPLELRAAFGMEALFAGFGAGCGVRSVGGGVFITASAA